MVDGILTLKIPCGTPAEADDAQDVPVRWELSASVTRWTTHQDPQCLFLKIRKRRHHIKYIPCNATRQDSMFYFWRFKTVQRVNCNASRSNVIYFKIQDRHIKYPVPCNTLRLFVQLQRLSSKIRISTNPPSPSPLSISCPKKMWIYHERLDR